MPATPYEPIAAQLPIGLQLLGKALEEARIFQIASLHAPSRCRAIPRQADELPNSRDVVGRCSVPEMPSIPVRNVKC
jgi:hypothetical protein